jgi:hypothetical protein
MGTKRRQPTPRKTTVSKKSLDVKKGSGFQKGRSWLADYGVTVKGSFVVAKDKHGNKIYKHAKTGEVFNPEAHGLSRSSSKGRSTAANSSSGSGRSNNSTRASNNNGKSSGVQPRSAVVPSDKATEASATSASNPTFSDNFQTDSKLILGALGGKATKAQLQAALDAVKSANPPANASAEVQALLQSVPTADTKKSTAITLKEMLDKYDQLTPTVEGLTLDGLEAAFKSTKAGAAATPPVADEANPTAAAANAPRSANFVESGKPTVEQAANSLTQAETLEMASLAQNFSNLTPQQRNRYKALEYQMKTATQGFPPGTLSAYGANNVLQTLSQQQAALNNPLGNNLANGLGTNTLGASTLSMPNLGTTGLTNTSNPFALNGLGTVGNNALATNPLLNTNPLLANNNLNGLGSLGGLGTNTLGVNTLGATTLGMANPTLGGLANTSNPFALVGMPNGLSTVGNNALATNPLLANNSLQQGMLKLL